MLDLVLNNVLKVVVNLEEWSVLNEGDHKTIKFTMQRKE